MCVIVIAETHRPTPEQVGNMYLQNDDGAGIAWREKGRVKWEKGFDLEGIQKAILEKPYPWVAHFRTASVGDPIPELTHPFVVSPRSNQDTAGETDGHVLFHNGHWGAWRSMALEAVFRGRIKLPVGKWSDSRMMAVLASHFGLGFLELLDEKIVAFGPNDCEIFGFPGKGWVYKDNFWASNRNWDFERRLPAAYQGSSGGRTNGTKKHSESCWCDECRALKDPTWKGPIPSAGGHSGDANPFREVRQAGSPLELGPRQARRSESAGDEEGEEGEGALGVEGSHEGAEAEPKLTAAEHDALSRLLIAGEEQIKWVRKLQDQAQTTTASNVIAVKEYNKPDRVHVYKRRPGIPLTDDEAWELMGESVQEGLPRSQEATASAAPISITHQDDQERERRLVQNKMGVTHLGTF